MADVRGKNVCGPHTSPGWLRQFSINHYSRSRPNKEDGETPAAETGSASEVALTLQPVGGRGVYFFFRAMTSSYAPA
jgi:hypothetical protein